MFQFDRFFDNGGLGILVIFGVVTTAQAAIIFLLYKRYKQSLVKYDSIDLELAGVRESTNQLWKEIDRIKERWGSFTSPKSPTKPQKISVPEDSTTTKLLNNTPKPSYTASAGSVSRVTSYTSEDYLSANDEPFTPLSDDIASTASLLQGIDEKALLKRMTELEETFQTVDELHEEGNGEQCYRQLKQLYDTDPEQRKNPELLWRLGRACHVWSSRLPQKDPQKKNLYLDKALAINPNEYSLLHMRGRFSYSVANLSWMERKVASSFFATPPEATFDDAIKDFLEVEKIKNGTWIDNLLYLAKSYLANKNKAEAVIYLKQAALNNAQDDADKESLAEVADLLKKNDK